MTLLLTANKTEIARAAAILRAGDLVAFGTETVYGLGGDATNPDAVAKIFAAKGRPHFNPLISHYSDAASAFLDVVADDRAKALAAGLWPGPLTMVLPRRVLCRVALLASAGLDSLAVRVPNHPIALELLRTVNRPVVAPSANRSGSISPTTASHVLGGLGEKIAAILDSGPCEVGVESTVVDLSSGDATLLRPGGVTLETIEALIGPVGRGLPHPGGHAERGLRSPGLMESHYAPTLPVRLDADAVAPDEALLSFGQPLPGAAITFELSRRGSITEAAARLFDGLHHLDAEGIARGLRRIAVMPVPDIGLGLAINDRLRRASAPRK